MINVVIIFSSINSFPNLLFILSIKIFTEYLPNYLPFWLTDVILVLINLYIGPSLKLKRVISLGIL